MSDGVGVEVGLWENKQIGRLHESLSGQVTSPKRCRVVNIEE